MWVVFALSAFDFTAWLTLGHQRRQFWTQLEVKILVVGRQKHREGKENLDLFVLTFEWLLPVLLYHNNSTSKIARRYFTDRSSTLSADKWTLKRKMSAEYRSDVGRVPVDYRPIYRPTYRLDRYSTGTQPIFDDGVSTDSVDRHYLQ